ncbi:unnamed protein product [Prorocentrum cordatum]|uniref:DEAD-box RNA helicase Q domain-containing protein n=1 Tax=Prorocentrum cordatum TaxID=2364126 RepID=A0ABN9QM65_9DINO|nr:unnamed protein product [Polarella glacialis]
MAAAADDTDDNAVSVQKSDGAAADWARPCSLSIEEAPLHELLRRELLGAGFVRPSPVQRHVWPLATRGWDLIAIAKTGSGKTLAFLLPAFTEVLEEEFESASDAGGDSSSDLEAED